MRPMLGVHFVGPRGIPVIPFKGASYPMEHRVYASEPTTEVLDGMPVETAPFWLFGFSVGQADCVYQGAAPLPDTFLARVVPQLRDAVRAELDTGLEQRVTVGD